MSGRALAASALVALAAGAAVPSQAQVVPTDTLGWEHIGPVKLFGVESVAFSGTPEALTIWVSMGSDVRKLEPLGTAWQVLWNASANGPLHLDLFAPPLDTLYSGTVLNRSLDGGRTFHRVTSPAAADPTYIGGSGTLGRIPRGAPFAGRLVAGDGFSLLYSDDGGDTWARTASSPNHVSFQVHGFRSGRVLSAGFYGATLSDDGAQSFRAVPDLYETAFVGFDLTHLAVLDGFVTGRAGDSAEGRVLIGGTQARQPFNLAWASDNEGSTWRVVGRFSAEDGGWIGLDAVPASVGGGPGWAIATMNYGRMYATTDGGETWTPFGKVPKARVGGNSPPAILVSATAVGPDGRFYTGLTRPGQEKIWQWKTQERVSDMIRRAVASESSPAPEAPHLGVSVRPNPAGGRAEVVLTLAEAQPVRVSVFDVQGREVAVLFDGSAAVGERRLGVDTSGWPAGIYVVRASTGTQSASARLVVAR